MIAAVSDNWQGYGFGMMSLCSLLIESIQSLLLAHREETEGAWVQFKKPVLAKMPVLDVSKISSKALSKLASDYDTLANEPFLLLPEIATDPTRSKIDAAISRALHLPELGVLRQLLGQEPILSQTMEDLTSQSDDR